MERRRTRPVKVGSVTIGGDAPVSVQSMTKTRTEDVDATVGQIVELARLGCEIIRCAVPNRRAARGLAQVVKASPLPVIADIHFNPHLALEAIESGASGVRVNPCTIADLDGLRKVFREAAAAGIKVRIGVNSGSVRPRDGLQVKAHEAAGDLAQLMMQEALRYCEMAEAEGCHSLVLSLKASDVPTTIRAYRLAAQRCNYPFHLGVTAAGPPEVGLVRSAVGLGALLAEGIGDTIRVSLTGPPHAEVKAARSILEALRLREPEGPEIISCPTCGRCEIDLVSLVRQVSARLEGSRRRLKVAIMGCVVNGPGEAAEADVGIAGGKKFGYLFRKGRRTQQRPACELADALIEQIEKANIEG